MQSDSTLDKDTSKAHNGNTHYHARLCVLSGRSCQLSAVKCWKIKQTRTKRRFFILQ